MFAQLFGYYLLKNNVISHEQLNEALVNKNIYKSKLGSLFTDAGYMTPEQAEYIHTEQKHYDKKFGDIAVFLGFLTRVQMEELVKKQEADDIALYETLIAKGYITKSEHENLLKTYRQELGLTDELSDKDLVRDLISIYELDEHVHKEMYAEYIALFVRNMIRFVGDDFAFSGFNAAKESLQECVVSQEIEGGDHFRIKIYGSEGTFNIFSERFSEKKNLIFDGVADFLDLQNGLYAANRFASQSLKMKLGKCETKKEVSVETDGNPVIVPFSYTFGKIYLWVSIK